MSISHIDEPRSNHTRFDSVELTNSYCGADPHTWLPSGGSSTVACVYASRGTATLISNGGEAQLREGMLAVTAGDDIRLRLEPWSGVIVVRLPRSEFAPLGVQTTVSTTLLHRLEGSRAVGMMLEELAAEASGLHSNPTSVAHMLTSVIAFAFAQSQQELRVDRRETMLASAKRLIEDRLYDLELSPATIAREHYVSTRSLHRLFEADGHTIAAWIRERRLERCRADLADPSRFGLPVGVIATRWGMPDAAHFSRSFKAAFGTAPREYRRAVMRQTERMSA